MSDIDIVPSLYEKIFNEYKKLINQNRQITIFLEKVEKEQAKSEEVSLYGNNLGECAATAFLKYAVQENLPEGKLYWNIAERLIKPLLLDVYERVNNAAEKIQVQEDKVQNISIKPQRALFPESRIKDLIAKTVEIYESENGIDG